MLRVIIHPTNQYTALLPHHDPYEPIYSQHLCSLVCSPTTSEQCATLSFRPDSSCFHVVMLLHV